MGILGSFDFLHLKQNYVYIWQIAQFITSPPLHYKIMFLMYDNKNLMIWL
jgi:hypothetical protein